MWKLTALCVVFVYVSIGDAYWLCSTSNKIVEAMENEEIDSVTSALPSKKLTVKYISSGLEPNLGNELKPKQLKKAPTVTWDGVDENKNYTLIFTDPDAPSRENSTSGEFLHWLVVNIPGDHLLDGEELVEYVGPAPPKNTGLHRYIFLLFEQDEGMVDFDHVKRINKRTAAGRTLFSTDDFVKENKLLIIPTAGNFFKAQYDESVPTSHKKLGINVNV